VIGAARGVLLRPAAELGPHERQHAVGDAARLEVGLEGAQPLRELREVAHERRRLVVVGVEVAGRVDGGHADAEREGQQRGEVAQVLGEAVGALAVLAAG
jgi:hypothetical protein